MLIDWFTVAAQIVNFLILVFLLHRFLYRPIIGHMTEREEKIRQRLEDAADKQREAQDQIEEFRRKCDDLDQETDKKMEQAQMQAAKHQEELLDKAKKHVEDQRAKWLQALDKEKAAFAREFKKRGSREILKYVRRVIEDLADEPLNNRLARILGDRIASLGQDDREKLRRAARTENLVVRSTFELDSPEKRKLTTILHEVCGKNTEVSYQVDEEYPLGIEARAGNIRLSWGIESYLEELQTRVASLVDEKTHGQEQNSDDGSAARNGEEVKAGDAAAEKDS